ncbi:MAG: glycosyltransferase WbuB [Legionellales bacterium]|nr:glycosyltransferase WbuB [Legionellales bacterium]|tara:strand:- start:8092 stop:9360 length:1269 start_codon:yes stop_codon:yes gene_type:complete
MGKVIWYCHHYAGSPSLGMSYRPYYLAQAFKKFGHKPYVVASSFHHLHAEPRQQSAPLVNETIDGVDYCWLKTNAYQGNGIGRIRNMMAYARQLKRQASALVKVTGQPEVIIVSSSHPLHFKVANDIAQRYDAQLIFEVRDLWPLSLIDLVGLSAWHPLVVWLGHIEKCAYRNADVVVSLLQDSQEHMVERGLANDKFHYIPNGVANNHLADIHGQLPSELELAINQQRQMGKTLIGYAGAHGIPNALDQLLDALAIVQEQGKSDIHVFAIGKGIKKQHLLDKARQLNLHNISFYPPIPKVCVPTFLQQMDGLYLGWQDKAIYRYGMSPNKLFDYMLAAKPVIHATNSSHDLVAQAECGVSVPAESPIDLATSLSHFCAMSPAKREYFGQNGKNYVLAHHNYDVLAQQYNKLFNDKDNHVGG